MISNMKYIARILVSGTPDTDGRTFTQESVLRAAASIGAPVEQLDNGEMALVAMVEVSPGDTSEIDGEPTDGIEESSSLPWRT